MAINTKIVHCSEYFNLSLEEKKEFDRIVLQEIREHPAVHLETEWGIFESLPSMTPEETEQYIQKLLSAMTLEQKVNQMSCDSDARHSLLDPQRYNYSPYYAGEDLQLGIPAVKFTDDPTGIVMGYHSTAFPVSIARGSTWDPELEQRVGEAIGIEGRSGGANFFAGVCINLLRHPAWGRAQETYGEDPFLLGQMGSALVTGVQKHMMACVKHFAANSMENARFKVNVEMDERTLREVYLPHFKACVDAGAAAIMSAYNRVRGQWCGHNSYLLNTVLKDEWAFRGFVMSDFIWGVRDTVEAANGGQCVEMNATQFFGPRLTEAVRDGKVKESVIDDAVRRIIRQKIRFSRIGDQKLYAKDRMGCPEHARLAREVSQKSTVLLKNAGILPLKKEKLRKIAVIGQLAYTPNTGDLKGSSAVFPPYVVTPLDGIRAAVGQDVQVCCCDGRIPHQAQMLAADADVAILVTGLTSLDEGEYIENGASVGGDRKNLGLSPEQEDLIEAVSQVNSRLVVVLQGGSAILVQPWERFAGAILMQWYPGMEGGTALAEILFGLVNPSAKLPVTIPATPQQLPYYDADATAIVYDYYHGYFLADKNDYAVSYPFGYGLSYTHYQYENVRVEQYDGKIVVSVDVQNVGDMAGEEVVQLYIGYRHSVVERHKKDLRGFSRVHLAPGERKTVTISIDPQQLAYYSIDEKQFVVEKTDYIAMIGASSAEKDLLCTDFSL